VSGQYTLDAELIASNDKTAVLQRADHDLVAISIEQLSKRDGEYLKTPEAEKIAKQIAEAAQTWTLRDGTQVVGRLVDYAADDMNIQRRRGRIYINDRVFGNLPEFYRRLTPQIVSHFEKVELPDRAAFEAWVLRQRGQPRTFSLEGVILEMENGDEYAVPFFLFSEQDRKVLTPGWDDWRAAHQGEKHEEQEELAFLLQSLAAARQRDKQVQREIARMQLKFQAVQAGLTSLWEVTLHPTHAKMGPSRWVVVPGRDSRQATINALHQFPGFQVGPIRRVAGF
jgi:hypothetical protein